MKKIKRGNKEFKIIPEANLVQGKMYGKWVKDDIREGIKPMCRDIIRLMAYYLRSSDKDAWLNDVGIDLSVVHANAYCDPEDEFDEKVGVDVCASKMDLKNHIKLAKTYRRMYEVLMQTANIVNNWCIKHQEKAMAIEADLCDYYGWEKL